MSKKTRKQFGFHPSFLVLAIALVVVLGVVGSVRANVLGTQEAVVRALATYLESNPGSPSAEKVVGALLAAAGADEESLGGTPTRSTFKDTVTPFFGLGLVANDVTVANKCESVTFPTTSSTVYTLTNRTQSDLLVNLTDLWVTKAPSATVVLTAGTSSNSALAYDELARVGTSVFVDGLYNRFVIPSSTGNDLHLANTRLSTSTSEAALNLASSTAFARCGNGLDVSNCRVGSNNDSVIIVQPNEYLLLHLESTDKRWAVTTTLSTSTPSTDPQDVRRRTEGDIGLNARFTACYRALTTSTPQ